jgi:hypothetical protein
MLSLAGLQPAKHVAGIPVLGKTILSSGTSYDTGKLLVDAVPHERDMIVR